MDWVALGSAATALGSAATAAAVVSTKWQLKTDAPATITRVA
jgi:hypothetical protein